METLSCFVCTDEEELGMEYARQDCAHTDHRRAEDTRGGRGDW